MKIGDRIHIKGRGYVVTMKSESEPLTEGLRIRRVRDGATWNARGIERFCKYIGRPRLEIGESVGIAVPADCDLVPGDEVEWA